VLRAFLAIGIVGAHQEGAARNARHGLLAIGADACRALHLSRSPSAYVLQGILPGTQAQYTMLHHQIPVRRRGRAADDWPKAR
jgi:hypothetical protein